MSGWLRVFVTIVVGAVAVAVAVAAFTDGKPLETVLGAVVGGVVSAFAPSVIDRRREKAAAREALVAAAELLPDGSGPAMLLHASRGVVPFEGREREVEELLAWCRDPRAGRLRLLTGPGGVGKSRLAVELAHRLSPGWGQLEVRDDGEADALARWRAVEQRQVLVVVDYAETRTGLSGLLHAVAGDEGRRVRVLLLARSAGEWWQQLGGDSARVRQMVAAAGSGIELAERVMAGKLDRDLVAEAVPYFAAALGVEPPQAFAVELGDGPHRILDLHAAALVAVLRSQRSGAGAVSVSVGDVLEELLGHERRYWLQSARARGFVQGAWGLSARVVEQTVAAGTLLGARDRAQAVEVVGRVPDGMASGVVADWLRELYPPEDGEGGREWLGRLRPDRLAELHVTRQLGGSVELLEGCLADLDERQARRALVTLARAAQELDAAGEILQRLLPVVAGEVGSVPAPRETLVALYEALPYPSMVLAEAHALLARRILDSTPADAEAGERARWLSSLSVHVSALGRPADALPVTEEAVTIYRELAAAYPDRYRPDLADSLTNLGVRFSELGRPADALPVTEEAVTIYRELAAAYPDRYRPDLADSLTNLGVRFAELGRPADALPVTEEAVTIYRELAAANPDRYRPDLARSLTNLGILFSELGRPADALPVEQEAVTIRRELAAAYPDRYRPDLARSLTNLGVTFSELGRPADALPVGQEAVTIYRELAAAYPHRYRPDLATSLNNLGVRFSALGRPADALPVTEEAVTIHRELAAANPHRYRPDLARSLTNLGVTFSELGRPTDALPVTEEAVTIRRELAAAYPDRYRPDLASSLNNLGVRFSALGRPANALPVTEEAVTIHRELAAAYPDRYRPDLASSLTNLGVRFSALGRPADALPVTEEAVTIHRELAAANPDRYRPDLATSLTNLGIWFAELGRPADALPVGQEAVTIYRELAAANPDRYRPDLATSLTNLGVTFSELNRPAEAEEMRQEAERMRAGLGDS
ncbi:tetratricopeptide repeat protein [Nonomuraea sp. ZG12]|uniref:tetratricopeptide repeat protein n=1 Tax=Nonomuraea sp. ZG12 TaxID=3452207 RepID=UPI003F8CA2C4